MMLTICGAIIFAVGCLFGGALVHMGQKGGDNDGKAN